MTPLVAVDLGGRTTARTALAVLQDGIVDIWSPERVAKAQEAHGESGADPLAGLLRQLTPAMLGIDAPLSLPDFSQPDYLRRPGDRTLKALSPMSMGEVTARALHLRHHLLGAFPMVEVYPAAVLEFLELPRRGYKNDPTQWPGITMVVCQRYGWRLLQPPTTDHEVDALLALVAVYHYSLGEGHYRNVGGDTQTPFIVPVQKG